MRQAIAVVCLNAVFWPLALLVTAVFAIVGTAYVIAFALVVRDRRQTLWLIRRTITHYGMSVIRCGWPLVRVKYVDVAPGDRPPFVFAANHRSASDAFLMAVLPFEAVQVVNLWPFKIPWLGFVARLAGYLSVRALPIRQFLDRGVTLLVSGCSIVSFPEGTRSGSRRLGSFHGSAFRLAQEAGASIAPLAISGAENVPRRGTMMLKPAVITVHKLPAIRSEEYRELTAFKLKALVRQRIQEHLRKVETP